MLVTVSHNEVQKQRMKSAFIASKQICPESMRWLRRTRVWLCLIGALVWTFFFQASRARGDR
jgi:hypothetical protein